MKDILYSEIPQDVYDLAALCEKNSTIDPAEYKLHDVKRGLRDEKGRGVVTGLTEISTVNGMRTVDGERVPIEGELLYRGYDIRQLVSGFLRENRFGFEETAYLLLFGELPNRTELTNFEAILADNRTLPTNFTRDVIMKAPSRDIMNSMARSVLTLASYDNNALDVSLPNVLRQSLQLISNFSCLAVYAYQAHRHYDLGDGLFIHRPDPKLSTAQNFLRMLRPNASFTPLEAKLLDVALVLHAEHGGGNNSTFTTHVVTSTGTDSYSSTAASLCSLKGPKHGGANLQVTMMFEDIKTHINDWYDLDEIAAYISKILNKDAYDHSGLVYGVGHAIYSISDPRAEIFKSLVQMLSEEKGRKNEFDLYTNVAEVATKLVMERRHITKGVSPNVDFYSGLAYSLLGLPEELFTPLFAVSRIVGWSAHRLEELINGAKLIRPAYEAVAIERDYTPLSAR